MSLRYDDRYVWDHWMFDTGELFHLFHLQAPRISPNASERHFTASIGHATSTDLKNWKEVGTILHKSEPGKWDDVATWTGSVIQDPKSKKYFLFYTGVHQAGDGHVQAIGLATSDDLITFTKYGSAPIASADPDFYNCQENGARDTDFRDPWVFYDARDEKWHMLITAISKSDSNIKTRGIVGHATSENLYKWHVEPPLSKPSGFGQTEVLQIVEIEGRYVAIFCCGGDLIDNQNLKPQRFITGTYSVPADSPTGPFHFESAEIFDTPYIYAGRVIRDRSGQLNLIGFKSAESDQLAPCELSDPIPVYLTESGILQVS